MKVAKKLCDLCGSEIGNRKERLCVTMTKGDDEQHGKVVKEFDICSRCWNKLIEQEQTAFRSVLPKIDYGEEQGA
jgi:hypothetical protein